ncbi:MAG: hypothetical protein ACYCYN_03065 [Solirubrobacteraceae bacterium]
MHRSITVPLNQEAAARQYGLRPERHGLTPDLAGASAPANALRATAGLNRTPHQAGCAVVLLVLGFGFWT